VLNPSISTYCSGGSTSLRPIYTILGEEIQGLIQENPGSCGTLSCSSLRRNETGCPWRFPDEVVRGVLMSAWASTQITQRSGQCRAWPLMVPIARLQGTNTVIEALCLAHLTNNKYLQSVQLTLCPQGKVRAPD